MNFMDEPKVTLLWEDINDIEQGYKLYKSPESIDMNSLPLPIILNNNITEYNDYDVVDGNTYYYRVSAYTPNGEAFSDEVSGVARTIYEFIIYTQGNDLIVFNKSTNMEIERITNTDMFSNLNDIFIIGDMLYYSNGSTLHRYNFPSMTNYESITFKYNIRRFDYDNNGIIYVCIYDTIYKLFNMEITYDISYSGDQYGARGVAAMKDGDYWAHTNASNPQNIYVRNKSDNALRHSYSVSGSLLAGMTFSDEWNLLFAGTTGNGRQVDRIDLTTMTRQTYFKSTTQPTYYNFSPYTDNSGVRRLQTNTGDPTLLRNFSDTFSDSTTESTSIFSYQYINPLDGNVYVNTDGNIRIINKDTNLLDPYHTLASGVRVFAITTR